MSKTLSVNYTTNGYQQVDDRSRFVFEGGHFIEVKVTGITAPAGFDLGNLYLESSIDVERYYALQSNVITGLNDRPIPVPSGSYTDQEYSTAGNEFIELHWPYHYGAESYELEWVHVNDYELAQGSYKTQG